MPVIAATILWYVTVGFSLAIAVAGIIGAIEAATTREDAFEAADRQPKWVWCGILVASAAVVSFQMPLLNWIGMVAIGIYYFDVRPQVKDIINGTYRW
ncbi:DUF2516 family protein [Corynebacterium sp. H130]|uniref:DUF2516 family protein n=1 Tax=Corynebacterium sp. H130 TaxID=3133444 RepID=UPI0030A2518C